MISLQFVVVDNQNNFVNFFLKLLGSFYFVNKFFISCRLSDNLAANLLLSVSVQEKKLEMQKMILSLYGLYDTP